MEHYLLLFETVSNSNRMEWRTRFEVFPCRFKILFTMKPAVLFETLFDVLYLSTILFLGFRMLLRKSSNKEYRLFSYMCLILGFGDCFHLLPRAYGLNMGKTEAVIAAIGIGNAVSSVGMAVFYVIMFELISLHYKQSFNVLCWATYILFALRVIFVLLPQNDWIHNTHDPLMSWLRNIPFILIGVIVDVLLFLYSRKEANDPLRGMWFWVLVSFGCYMPVALIHLGGMKDALLMIVKTIAYIMIVITGYSRIPCDIKRD